MSTLQLQGLLSINNSTMRRPTATRCYGSERKTAIVRKDKALKTLIKIAKAALPAACVVVAGPAVSCLPLGSLAPILAILVTSFASTYSDRKATGVAVVLIQGCGLRGFEGRMLALLSFLSFSSTFDKLDESLHGSSKGLTPAIGIIHSAFAGAFLSVCSGLLGILQAIAFTIRGSCTNTCLLASQRFKISWSKSLSCGMLSSPLESLLQTPDDSHSMESCEDYDGDSSNPRHSISRNMSQGASDSEYPPTKVIQEASSVDLLANCESVKGHEAEKGSCSNDMERDDQTLIDEVIRLIDECDGTLSPEEWDEIIAALD